MAMQAVVAEVDEQLVFEGLEVESLEAVLQGIRPIGMTNLQNIGDVVQIQLVGTVTDVHFTHKRLKGGAVVFTRRHIIQIDPASASVQF